MSLLDEEGVSIERTASPFSSAVDHHPRRCGGEGGDEISVRPSPSPLSDAAKHHRV